MWLSVLFCYFLWHQLNCIYRLKTLYLDFCIKQVSICCSFYAMGQVGPVNGMMTMGVSKPQSTPAPSTTSKSAKEYDFSSLTQGMFAKQWWLSCSIIERLDENYRNCTFFFNFSLGQSVGCKPFVELVQFFILVPQVISSYIGRCIHFLQ